ncbi:MAG: alpha-galactosidase [Acidobacteria bacterium]|nr:alpha-galactosidase [Acidobacteriota bacterium]
MRQFPALSSILLFGCLAGAGAGPEVSIRFARDSAVYRSGSMVYREQMRGGRLVALPFGRGPNAGGASPAFALRVRMDPSAPESDLTSGWKWERTRTISDRHAVIELAHQSQPVALRVHTELDGSAVITRWLEVRNGAPVSIAITSVAPWCGALGKGSDSVRAGYTTRQHYPWEGWFEWRPLAAGHDEIRQETGLGYHHPVFLLHNDTSGESLLAQLAWPANRRFEFERGERITFRPWVTGANAYRVIPPGGTVRTPAVHVAYGPGGLDDVIQQMHEHVRRSVLPRYPDGREYRIQCLMPEDQSSTIYRGAAYNEANLTKLLDVAGAAGVELFILDGPFWLKTYGEGPTPEPSLFPRGLRPLVEKSHSLSMLFGLYLEPEGGRDGFRSPGSTLVIGPWSRTAVYRDHPGWFVPGKSSYPAPYLNLAIPGAAAYMGQVLEDVVREYGIDLYRHDFCMPEQGDGPFTLRDGFRESDYARHYDALYEAFDRVRANHPELLLQQASGGGTRLDLASLAHWHEHFTSDRTSTPHVYRMLSGLTVYLPPEVLVTPMGMADPKHRPDFRTLLRSTYAMANTPMLFNSLLARTEDRGLFLRYAKLYKEFMRPVLSHVKVYHHAPVNVTGGVATGDWFAMEFASADRSRAWALIVRLAPSPKLPFVFRPKSLDARAAYRMTSDNSGQSRVVRAGVAIPMDAGQESELLLFER